MNRISTSIATQSEQELLNKAEQTIYELQAMLLEVGRQPDGARASEHAYYGLAIAERYWENTGRKKPYDESEDELDEELED